jgi:hypothetical protein
MAFENLLLYLYGGYLVVWENTRQTIALIFRGALRRSFEGGQADGYMRSFPKIP